MKSYEDSIRFKAEERIQIIEREIANASFLIISAFNKINWINAPRISQEKVFDTTINDLEVAIKRLNFSRKLYNADATPELKDCITSHFEQRRLNSPRLQCVSTHHAQDEIDGE